MGQHTLQAGAATAGTSALAASAWRPLAVVTPPERSVGPELAYMAAAQSRSSAAVMRIPPKLNTSGRFPPTAIPANTLVQRAQLSPDAQKQNSYFQQLIRLVHRSGFFDGLECSSSGELRINVPFCGCFTEAPSVG